MSKTYKDYIESSTLPSSVKEVYRIDKGVKEKHAFYLRACLGIAKNGDRTIFAVTKPPGGPD